MNTTVSLQQFKTGHTVLTAQHNSNWRSDKQKPPARSFGQLTLNGLTMKGRRTIKRACAHLEHYNKETSTKSTFITLTVPFVMSDDEIKQALRLLLKRWRKSYGSFMYLWVLEIQMKRLEKTGIRAPHIHLCTSLDYIPADKLRKQWKECISRVMQLDEVYREHVNVDIQHVKKSLAAYMSKYLSKVDTETTGNNWSVSQTLRKYMKPTISCVAVEGVYPDTVANYTISEIPENFSVYIYGIYQFYFLPCQREQVIDFFYNFAGNNLSNDSISLYHQQPNDGSVARE